MIAWRPLGILLGSLLGLLLMVVLTGMLTNDLAGTWRDVRQPLLLLAALLGGLAFGVGVMSVMRIRARAARDLGRYEILLAQADEATGDEVWRTCDTLVKTVRTTLLSRIFSGQPWIAFEIWHDPPRQPGETGQSTLMLLCEPMMVGRVIGTLRRISPNMSVRHQGGQPRRYGAPNFTPDHVLRVHKAREWQLPITDPKSGGGKSNARSSMASIMRAQQQLGTEGFASCVRVCIMPAEGSMDRLAARRLRQMADRAGGPNAAVSSDIMQAQKAGGGTISFVEVQSAIQDVASPRPAAPTGREGRHLRRQAAGQPATWAARGRQRWARWRARGDGDLRQWTFADLQTLCQGLLAPAMSDAAANTLTERFVYARQGLYQRRWPRATPPLIPDQDGSTAMWPIELAMLIEPANLASEFDLPVERHCVPNLPAPRGLPRATMLDLPRVPDDDEDEPHGAFRTTRKVRLEDVEELITDVEIVDR
jgi:hypothetical protein